MLWGVLTPTLSGSNGVYEVLHLAVPHGVAMCRGGVVGCGSRSQIMFAWLLPKGSRVVHRNRFGSIVRPGAGQFFDVLSTQI